MKPARLAVLGIALLAGGAAALMMGGGDSPPPPQAVEASPAMKTVEVLVASVDVPMGQTLKAGDLRWLAWPTDSAPSAVIKRTEFPNGLEEVTPNGPGKDVTRSVVRALEKNGMMRLLAEPTLVAVSGESAKFLAGGEIPYPAGETFDSTTNRTTITISYRPIGVSLNFTPVVLSERRISLRIATEVSELDKETAIRLTSVSVPGVKTRRTETTVEVPSGASLISAGMIQQSSRQVIDGFPGLKNLPILGALFRSREYERQETELMIMVTPFIAKPINPDEATRPDDGFVDAHDAQAVLLGRLNRLYGVAGATPAAGLKGKFGFITD
jgi:pilus assembly protein CpaC